MFSERELSTDDQPSVEIHAHLRMASCSIDGWCRLHLMGYIHSLPAATDYMKAFKVAFALFIDPAIASLPGL